MLSQAHLFSPNYPSFMALGGVSQELSRGGDSSRHRSKESPPWVCEKCAKKRRDEMGCGEEVQDPVDPEDDELGCDKCKEGQRKKRKARAEAAAAYYEPYNMRGAYQVVNAKMGQAQEYTCPVTPPAVDPTLNCQRDKRGNAVCSDGRYFPPGCPNTPPESAFSSGIAEDEVIGGMIQAKVPPPRGAGALSSGGVSTPLVVGAAALGVGTLLFFLFK